jgi:site-specific recombinase XerD
MWKRFTLWLIENGHPLDEKMVRKIRIPSMDRKTKTSNDLLTKDEVLQVIAACENSRDRAFIAMLYDGSNRPIELRKLRWGDLQYDQYGVRFRTSAKTGFERWIRLTFSVSYLASWKNDYPGKTSPDAFVFVTLHLMSGVHRPMSKSNIEYLIRKLKEKTGNNKIHAYVFRHTKISHDIEDGHDQSYLMLKNWGHFKTNMLDVYGHPRMEILEQQALQRAGMIEVQEQPKEKPITAHQCSRCAEVNAPTNQCCAVCGEPLTDDARAAREAFMDESRQDLESDPRFLELQSRLEDLERKQQQERDDLLRRLGLS